MEIVDKKLWLRRKKEFRQRLEEDLRIGYLDRDIMDVLQKFFSMDSYYTLSSCSGRVTVVDAVMPWERENSSVIFKKHSPITVEEVSKILNQRAVWTLWLVVTGPIIHISSISFDDAVKLLSLVRNAGMKHSGIMSVSRKGVVVEATSGVFISTPLKSGPSLLMSEDSIPQTVSLANKALIKGKERLNRLRKALGLETVNYFRQWSTHSGIT